MRLVELTIGQATALCKLPAERYELTTTELLRHVAKDAERPLARYVTDPLLWTVEERTLLLCNYLAHVTPDGPNFAVGDTGHLADYVMFDRDSTVDHVDLGQVANYPRVMRPLLGIHAQTLETVCKSRGEWIIGAIACQIQVAGEPEPEWAAMSDVDMLKWVTERMEKVRGLRESDFEQVWDAYWRGADALTHFFNLNFDDAGLIYEDDGKEGAGQLAPARFRADTCISPIAKALAG